MGELHMFFPDRSGISIENDEEPKEFTWIFCDVCNKPQDQIGGSTISRDGEALLWTCETCRQQGFYI